MDYVDNELQKHLSEDNEMCHESDDNYNKWIKERDLRKEMVKVIKRKDNKIKELKNIISVMKDTKNDK